MAAPLTPSRKVKINIGSKMILVRSPATIVAGKNNRVNVKRL